MDFNNFDFSVEYPGVSKSYIKNVIENMRDPFSLFKETMIKTSENPPRLLVFRKVRKVKFRLDDPDDYIFKVHGPKVATE